MTFIKHLILFIATLALLMSAGPAAADELYFSPADNSIFSFDPFPVHVMVDDIGSIMGYNISVSLTGDPCVMVVSVEPQILSVMVVPFTPPNVKE